MNLHLLLFGLPGYATIQNHIFTRICRATLGHRKEKDNILSFNPFLRGQASQKVKTILGKRSYSCFEGNSAGITPLHALWLAVSDNTTMVYFHSWHWTWRFCCGVHVNEWCHRKHELTYGPLFVNDYVIIFFLPFFNFSMRCLISLFLSSGDNFRTRHITHKECLMI